MLGFAVGLSIMLFEHDHHDDFSEPIRALLSTLDYGLYSEFGDIWLALSSRRGVGGAAGGAGGVGGVGGVGGAGEMVERRELNWFALVLFQLMM